MARKTRRSVSRKMKMSKRNKTRRTMRRSVSRRNRRTHGGEMALRGAPVTYSLAGDWSSRMSLGQGADFFKYHEGQHGGQAPFPGAVVNSTLPAPLRGPAHLDGLDKAFVDIAGLKDQAGGKRRKVKGRKQAKRSTKKNRTTRRKRTMRKRGGALGYAPVSMPGMLLSGPRAYAQAGLNPEWKTDVAFADAKIRNTQ